MKKVFNADFMLLWIILLSGNRVAQSLQWNIKEIDNGKITVSYRISERIDETGKKVPLIEDSSNTIDSVGLKSCISLMKDVSKHKIFTGDYSSKRVKTISDSECIVYYYSRNPWPIKNSDCVARMIFSIEKTEKTAQFKLTVTPTEFKKKMSTE